VRDLQNRLSCAQTRERSRRHGPTNNSSGGTDDRLSLVDSWIRKSSSDIHARLAGVDVRESATIRSLPVKNDRTSQTMSSAPDNSREEQSIPESFIDSKRVSGGSSNLTTSSHPTPHDVSMNKARADPFELDDIVFGVSDDDVPAFDDIDSDDEVDDDESLQSNAGSRPLTTEPTISQTIKVVAQEKPVGTRLVNSQLPPSLPVLVESLLQYLPVPYFEPPIPSGKRRARWRCVCSFKLPFFISDSVQGCGVRLFDDFTELYPGGMQELETDLQSNSFREQAGNARQTIREAFIQLFAIARQLISRRNVLTTDPALSGTELPSYNAPSNTNEQPNNEEVDPRSLYLLLCVDEGSSRTVLHQQKLTDISRDRDMFRFIRSQYYRLQKPQNWLTIRSINRLSLSQV
jgi:hypothetical protein